MSGITLKILIRLLAFLTSTLKNTSFVKERKILILILQKQFKPESVNEASKLFEQYLHSIQELKITKPVNEKDLLAISELTENIIRNLVYKQRVFILVSLLDFARHLSYEIKDPHELNSFYRHVKIISGSFKLDEVLYIDCKRFIEARHHSINNKKKFLVISGQPLEVADDMKNHVVKNLTGNIFLLNLGKDFFLLMYSGNEVLNLDNKPLKPDSTYFFSSLSVISGPSFNPIYFNDVNKLFLEYETENNLILEAKTVTFLFKGGLNGIRDFNLWAESNELIGIIGGSGTGKTTLLNLLNGNLIPQQGSVLINGHDISVLEGSQKSIIGYIPQDEILIGELTVFENLYFNSKLCMGKQPKELLVSRVNDTLEAFGLLDVKDLKVGTVLNKTISGGQRKRLNIAIELIRDPHIIFTDEPTSGLSSYDSYRILYLLKQQALRQKIVFVNIHQPSNELFYMFDRVIILDKGGYQIYTGKPGDAINHFRKTINQISTLSSVSHQSEPEEMLSIIEDTKINEFGFKTNERIIKPHVWQRIYNKQYYRNLPDQKPTKDIPKFISYLPNAFKQFNTYFNRNVISRWRDIQYRILMLTVSPFLAFVLSFFCKQMVTDESGKMMYDFSSNSNIPSLYFMSVIVAVFVGLVMSAEELHRDNKHSIRERFLNLNLNSYFSSKLVMLFFISSYQTLSYSLISQFVLHLSGNFFIFWTTLLTLSFLSNVLGLLISGFFKSLVAIYITIPLILVPQILLSGVVIDYNKIHPALSTGQYVPVFGDLMPVRWANEALIYNQFRYNDFEKDIYKIEQKCKEAAYCAFDLVPELQSITNNLEVNDNIKHTQRNDLKLLYNELNKFVGYYPFNDIEGLRKENVNKKTINELAKYLVKLQRAFQKRYSNFTEEKDSTLLKRAENMGGINKFVELKKKNVNKAVHLIALNSGELTNLIRIKNQLVQRSDPAYHIPDNKYGRAHLYAPVKNIGSIKVNTIIFNNLVMLVMTLAAFIVLKRIYNPDKSK